MIAEARAVIPGPVKLALISGMGVVRGVVHRGNGASCPVCGWSFRRFLTFRGRAGAQCPRCLSLERHRGMVEVCRDEIGLFERAARVLHVAPERMLARRLRTNPRLEYVSGDIEPGRADMVLDLTAIDAPAVEPPPGIEIVTWAERPDLAEGLWEVAREAAPDIPGEEETDVGELDEWLERDMRGGGDRPEAVFVAIEDGEVLGYAKLAFSEETTERAFHDLTGVKRAHRGRGIAAVLKSAQIAWAKENGYRTLQTSNEVRNAPIRHLNAKHGYVLEPGVVIVRRALAAT